MIFLYTACEIYVAEFIEIGTEFKQKSAKLKTVEFLSICTSFTPLSFQKDVYGWKNIPWLCLSERRENFEVTCAHDFPLRRMTASQSARQKLWTRGFASTFSFVSLRCPLGCIAPKKPFAANKNFLQLHISCLTYITSLHGYWVFIN